MKYYIKRRSDYLMHKKGEEREDHKYIKREWKNNKWVYYYEKETDDLFDSSSSIDSDDQKHIYTDVGKISRSLRLIKEKVNKLLETPAKSIDKLVDKGRNVLKKLGIDLDNSGKPDVKEVLPKNQVEEAIKKRVQNILESEKIAQKNEDRRSRARAEQKAHEEENIKYRTDDLKDFSDLKRIDEKLSNDENQSVINPYYNTGEYEFTNNCAYCTAAYDLRKRGYDVEAAPKDRNLVTSISEIESWYEGGDFTNGYLLAWKKVGLDEASDMTTQVAAVKEDMLSHGDGTRGFLTVAWTIGYGHAMAYEIENGEVVIRDCQTNDIVQMDDLADRILDISYMRTDNLEPSKEILKVVRNKGD